LLLILFFLFSKLKQGKKLLFLPFATKLF